MSVAAASLCCGELHALGQNFTLHSSSSRSTLSPQVLDKLLKQRQNDSPSVSQQCPNTG